MMNRGMFTCLAVVFLGSAVVADAQETLAERLYRSYTAIQSLSYELRKETTVSGKTVRTIATVQYRKPGLLHVRNSAPIERMIVIDGARLYYRQQGLDRVFARPIPELTGDWARMARTVPGTPMENLDRLQGLAEIELPRGPRGRTRRGYPAGTVFVVLFVDTDHNLTRMEFYKSAAMTELTGHYEYGAYIEATPGCRLPRLHRGTAIVKGEEVRETKRLTNVVVNKPLSMTLFDAGRYFGDEEFVSSFPELFD